VADSISKRYTIIGSMHIVYRRRFLCRASYFLIDKSHSPPKMHQPFRVRGGGSAMYKNLRE
jgi:hypothetical protein